MRPAKGPVLYEDLTFKIIGCAMKVHKDLGSIHKEVVYQRSLFKSLVGEGLDVKRELRLPVIFEGEKVGTYVPDIVVNDCVLIELKALSFLPVGAENQLSYYLKATGYKIGLILNFGAPSLQIKRRIYG